MRGRFWTPKTKHRVSNKKLVTNNPHVARLSLGCEFTKQKLRITQYPIDSSVQYIFSLRIYTNDSLKNLILRKETEEEDKTLVEVSPVVFFRALFCLFILELCAVTTKRGSVGGGSPPGEGGT